MNGLTRPNLPLMIEIERIVQSADADELLRAVEIEDYMEVVQAFHHAIERISTRLEEDSYAELTREQLLMTDAVLRVRLQLLLTQYLSSLLGQLAHSYPDSPFTHLNNLLFDESEETPDA
jgi:hypothetical protein